MTWTKPSIVFFLGVLAAGLVGTLGISDAAGLIFIALALYIVYKTWSRNTTL